MAHICEQNGSAQRADYPGRDETADRFSGKWDENIARRQGAAGIFTAQAPPPNPRRN